MEEERTGHIRKLVAMSFLVCEIWGCLARTDHCSYGGSIMMATSMQRNHAEQGLASPQREKGQLQRPKTALMTSPLTPACMFLGTASRL